MTRVKEIHSSIRLQGVLTQVMEICQLIVSRAETEESFVGIFSYYKQVNSKGLITCPS
jgi:hypothetical protein